jgi:hypothetical protein
MYLQERKGLRTTFCKIFISYHRAHDEIEEENGTEGATNPG